MRWLTVRHRPCPPCPYRLDVPSGLWAASDYDKLPSYDGSMVDQAAAGATGVFLCHQRTGHVCAGWAGCHNLHDTLAARLAIGAGELDPAALDYQSPIPLFPTGTEAAAHGKRDIDHPGPAALAAISKLRALRARKGRHW